MDGIVSQAIAKWPNVPHCYGWLGLDARGNWYLRNGQAQALGAFASGTSRTARSGFTWNCKFTPWVWRIAAAGGVTAHTGLPAQVSEALVDEAGHAYLVTDLGLGLVHTQDMGAVADAVEQDRWRPRPVRAAGLPACYGFVSSPQARMTRSPI